MTTPAGGPAPSGLDLRGDHHVHSTFSDDAVSTLAENLDAARDRGLTVVRMVEHVRRGATHVPDFLRAAEALDPPEGLTVLTGVEAKLLDTTGSVDAPPEVLAAVGAPRGPGRVLLADHQLPAPDGPWSPRVARERLAAGLPAADAVGFLVTAYARALAASGPAQLAHPFSILPKIGLAEDEVTAEHLDALADALRAAGGVVEVNEKWRCPGARVAGALRAAGVDLVASTDAHDARDVGRYRWLAGDA
ncbi:PHP domain-containing protein [Isoptericola sp. NPDC056605]|uniref:PHP domain-containing protein n=1 Tax=Isoptericola sp. NPDC056605 TaxID=3345876 RepID=UPI0036B570B1